MNRKRLIRGIVLGWLLLSLITPIYHVTATPTDYWPDQTWRTSTPEAQGMDSENLAKMLDFIQSNSLNIHSVIIIRHGYVVLETYAEPFRKDIIHTINSCTKSFTSALVGIALDKGYIKNVNQNVVDIFSNRNIQNMDKNKRLITIQHLLTMSSGFDMDEFSYKRDKYLKSSNWTQYYLNLPVTTQPGKVFNYDSEGVNLLMSIVQKTSGMKISDFAGKFLYKPIGITNYYWKKDPQGINTGGWGLALTPMEMARFGYLYLKKGNWDGKQIISGDWVETSMTKHIDSTYSPFAISINKGYGYLWWGLPFDDFTAAGSGGQYIMVMPKRDMVVVFTSGLGTNLIKPLKLTEDFILKSIVSSQSIAQNLDKQSKLVIATREFGNPSSQVKSVIPDTAHKISGKKIMLDANPWKLKSIMLNFNGIDECTYEEDGQGRPHFKMVVGLDGKYRENKFARVFRHLSRGYWTRENTFVIDFYRPWDNCSRIQYLFRFDNDKLTMTAESVEEWRQVFTGKIVQ
jgi:CubicO group peptidase (beta-lactamase class C family)